MLALARLRTLALDHYARQRRITAAGVRAVEKASKSGTDEVVKTLAAYQLASATASANMTATMAAAQGAGEATASTVPAALAGASSLGFPLTVPLASIDDLAGLLQFVAAELQDAGRTASQVELAARPRLDTYVRLLNPPSCPRCAVLAGRVYRWSTGFRRHPLCDCVMVPTRSQKAAESEGLVSDPLDAFERGMIHGLSAAEVEAIQSGADISQVVNAHRGMSSLTDSRGKTWQTTSEGTTRRGLYGRRSPRRRRLTPGQIIANAEGLPEAQRRTYVVEALRMYGYIH